MRHYSVTKRGMNNEINRKNLKRLCWGRSLSVAALARQIGVSRQSVYRAVGQPQSHQPTFRKIRRVLL